MHASYFQAVRNRRNALPHSIFPYFCPCMENFWRAGRSCLRTAPAGHYWISRTRSAMTGKIAHHKETVGSLACFWQDVYTGFLQVALFFLAAYRKNKNLEESLWQTLQISSNWLTRSSPASFFCPWFLFYTAGFSPTKKKGRKHTYFIGYVSYWLSCSCSVISAINSFSLRLITHGLLTAVCFHWYRLSFIRKFYDKACCDTDCYQNHFYILYGSPSFSWYSEWTLEYVQNAIFQCSFFILIF